MRLLVVSHTPHHRAGDRLVGWGPTVREIDHLAGLFDELVHVAPVHAGCGPGERVSVSRANVRCRRGRPAGGGDRCGEARTCSARCPRYAARSGGSSAAAMSPTCAVPSNIGLVAALLLSFGAGPRCAGSSTRETGIRRGRRAARTGSSAGFSRGGSRELSSPSTGGGPSSRRTCDPFLNPGLTDGRAPRGRGGRRRGKTLSEPLGLPFRGARRRREGMRPRIEILAGLKRPGVCDADARDRRRRPGSRPLRSSSRGGRTSEERVRFHGWLPAQALAAYYRPTRTFFCCRRAAAKAGRRS